MLRSHHGSAIWTHSPHELAKECAGWRSFRHLTYDSIRSYVVFSIESAERCGLSAIYWDDLYCRTSLFLSTQKLLATLQHEGIVTTEPLLQSLLHKKRLPGIHWSEAPHRSLITFKIALRLGVSCYLCGTISRGLKALTTDRRLASAWWKKTWLLPVASGLRIFDYWDDRGEDTFFLNPLCKNCMTSDAYQPVQKMFREMRKAI